MDDQADLRNQLVRGLGGRDAHMSLDDAVAAFPAWAMNERAPNVGYTPWHILEHLRITQWDILRYIVDPAHVSPDWPIGYWPDPDANATPEQFAATVEGFRADLAALEALALDPATDLLAPMAHTPGHTVARELRILANHNSYHLGEFAALRQVMGSWGPGHDA
ncbi:MAG: DinB family protein [Candidatus Limnocylindrales bacterium]